MHNFSGTSDGSSTGAGLTLSSNTLFGTAQGGGSSALGTVFRVNTDGNAFTNLHSFTSLVSNTNSDGAQPTAGVILSGNTLYGTARVGGSLSNGTVFKVSTDATGFTNLHNFTGTSGPLSTNSDGAQPFAGLVLSGNALFGMAYLGGSSGNGTVFKVNTDGTGFTNLHPFTALVGNTNSDGVSSFGTLVLSGNTLYGAAQGGGSSSNGTVFKISTNGTGFTVLYNFTALNNNTNGDGANPVSLMLTGNTLYGTTHLGDSSGNGTVFSLSLPSPQLTLVRSGTNVILTWSTNAAGFTLQCTTNLVSPAVWTTVSPAPVVVNGQNAVTNPISGTQKFYRLSQ